MTGEKKILLTNSFPYNLIRREVMISPITPDQVKEMLTVQGFESAWGHASSHKAATEFLGFDVTPPESRPNITLSESNLPVLSGQVFDNVLIISAVPPAEKRPVVRLSDVFKVAIQNSLAGKESDNLRTLLTPEYDNIRDWNCLLLSFIQHFSRTVGEV